MTGRLGVIIYLLGIIKVFYFTLSLLPVILGCTLFTHAVAGIATPIVRLNFGNSTNLTKAIG